ncbi:MAG: glycosyltransferase family 2 protein [Flavobacteriales bacterium]|nr:glycosyltransferase family 2 protein [Flavobacteriales bacterium]
MDVAVVILNWNGADHLAAFLPSVLKHSQGARVIVADNGSTDASLSTLERDFPTVEVIELGSNLGFAGGYNKALSSIHAEHYVLLNSDVEVTPGWLAPLLKALTDRPDLAAVQPKVLDHVRRNRFEHAGAAGGFIDRNGYPFCRGRIFELTEEDHGQYDSDRDIFWATGACMMVRATAFRQVGGFDADLFAHMEEIDLCWRARRRGWRIGFVAGSTVYHLGGGSLGYGSPFKTYLNFRNSLIVLTKNLRSRSIFLRILRRLILDGFAAIKFLMEGHAAHTWQVGRAHRHYFMRLPAVLRQRKELAASEDRPDMTGLYRRSVAYDRFILGQRTFDRLDQSAFMQRAPRSGQQPNDNQLLRAP